MFMANSEATGVRHVRCPRCHGLLQEPSGVPVYQCGGCGATLRAKNRSGDAQGVTSTSSASLSRSGLPPPPPPQMTSWHSGSGDVASTSSAPTPDARSSEQRAAGTTSRYECGDLVSARKDVSGGVASTSGTPDDVTTRSRRQATETRSRPESAGDLVSASEKRQHDQSTNRGAHDNSEFCRQRGTGDAERNALSPGVSVSFPGGAKDAAFESQLDTEKRGTSQAELPDDARKKKHSQFRGDRQQLAPKSAAQAAEPQTSRDSAAAAGGKVSSPPRHELQQAEDLAPLRHKILKTVDELKGDLSELFSKSPDLNPTTTRARPPRLPPKQQGYGAARARHAAAVVDHHGNAARPVKPGHQVAAAAPPPPRRGLPSRRYRRCRADPCCDNVQPRTCHHGCCDCRHHGKPECSSCRGHCGRPSVAQQGKPPAAKEANKRRPPPRHHCRPVLKGAPFIVCSSCFQLVQVPADFAVSTNRLRKLRCGSCSTVLSYSYRDPARKKAHQDSMDRFSTDGSDAHGGKGCYAQPDPFADDFGLSSYSTTEDEQPLHVSRNTSFDTVDGAKQGVGRLHRLMGYGSASELLRRSPDLYESFDERTTPGYDRKGKGVCIDAGDDDSDDEDSGVLMMRSAARGDVWPLPGMLGKGAAGPGAIRIKS